MPKKKVELHQDFTSKQIFRRHGDYSSENKGHFVLSQVTGPFNLEMFVAHRKAILPLYAEACLQGRFVVLTEIHNSLMMSAETMAYLAETVAIAVKEFPQLTGVAFVAVHDVEGDHLMAELIDKQVFQPVGLPFKIFDNIKSADAWLDKLYSEANVE